MFPLARLYSVSLLGSIRLLLLRLLLSGKFPLKEGLGQVYVRLAWLIVSQLLLARLLLLRLISDNDITKEVVKTLINLITLSHEIVGHSTRCHVCLRTSFRDGIAKLTHASNGASHIATPSVAVDLLIWST